ncbi:MAG TPA: hypothetical protein VK081_12215 [Planctomycetota bacterium]|nr:hypothetical protein [Planctomycetota bacterium]
MTHAVLQGDLALDNSSGNLPLGANRVDLDRELGAEDPSVAPYVRAEVGLPIGAVTLSGFTYSETGSGTLAPNHQYGDIPGGSQVSTFLSFTNVKAAAHFDLFDFGIVRVSPGLGVDYFEIDMQVTDVVTTDFERVDNEAFVPMVFLQAEVDLGIVAGTLDIGYMEADLEDADGRYLDVEALVRFNPVPVVELFAGYRFIDLDARGRADSRNFSADVQLHGWMIGGGVAF